MFKVDVLGSGHGDCLVLQYGPGSPPHRLLIDGGPSGIYCRFLRPYLAELRGRDGADRPVAFELAMVSHIDQDHIKGLLDLTDEMLAEADGERHPARIVRFWHNSFGDLTEDAIPAALTATIDAAIASEEGGDGLPGLPPDGGDGRAGSILASISQGRKLRDNLVALGLDGNRPFGNSLVLSGKSAELPDGMRLTVIGPDRARLADLQQDWNPALDPAEIAAITDQSIANLSSIVVLVEHEGQRMLLTGDARGDDIVAWLETQGLKAADVPFHVEILKVPHHGSDRNVDPAFFDAVTADIYIFCGDGTHDNPEPATLRMMREARAGGNGYTVVLSGPVRMEHAAKQPDFDAELAALATAGVTVRTRQTDRTFIEVIP